jgi:hypothetical protein
VRRIKCDTRYRAVASRFVDAIASDDELRTLKAGAQAVDLGPVGRRGSAPPLVPRLGPSAARARHNARWLSNIEQIRSDAGPNMRTTDGEWPPRNYDAPASSRRRGPSGFRGVLELYGFETCDGCGQPNRQRTELVLSQQSMQTGFLGQSRAGLLYL